MEVCLLGSVGVIRYSSEIYKNIRENEDNFIVKSILTTSYPHLGPALTFSLQTFLKNFNSYDIVHNLPGYALYSFMKWKPITVTTAHEFQRILYPELDAIQKRTFRDMVWSNLVVKESIRSILSSDYIIANSSQTREEAIRLGCDKRRVFLTPLGVDERFLKNRKGIKRSDEFKVGFIGTMSPRKNINFIINSFKKIKDSRVKLELWGKTLYSGNELSKWIGADKRITVKPFAPENRFVDVFDSFDVFVYPSLYEGFGLPILEAKARGLPVIIYRDGHIPKEVRKYCFEAKDEEHMAQIIDGIRKNGYNERLMKRATKDARTFTWKRTAKRTMDAYKKMYK